MKILAIETSCDETAISVVEAAGKMGSASFRVLSNVVQSQIDIHRKYGGVYPTLAKREHSRNLIPVLCQALKSPATSAKVKNHGELKKLFEREPELYEQFIEQIPPENPGIDAIAVTHGPGLEPALWVGINFAKALATVWDVPAIPVNHMEGHIFSAFIKGGKDGAVFNIQNLKFPALALLVSGGHTELILIKDYLSYEKIGGTRDDAVGEAFDKVARMLDLPYPGGPEISKLADTYNESVPAPVFPRPMIDTPDFDFSFSGLKTAVLYELKKKKKWSREERAAIAHAFQKAVIDVLVSKTKRAVANTGAQTLLLGGGVAANTLLRTTLCDTFSPSSDKKLSTGADLLLPDLSSTTDNALMIAVAGYFQLCAGNTLSKNDLSSLSAAGNLSL